MMRFLLMLVLSLSLYGSEVFNPFLKNDNIISEKSQPKLVKMMSELKYKTGVSVYAVAVNNMGGKSMAIYREEIANTLKDPYVAIILAVEEKKLEMIMSEKLKAVIDKDEILDDYMLPIMVDKRKDITKETQYTAALFNGMAQVADTLAEARGIILEESIRSDSKNFTTGLRWLTYLMILTTAGLVLYRYLESKGVVNVK